MTLMKKYAVCFKFLEGKSAIVWTIIMKQVFLPIHLCSLKLPVEGSHLSLWRLFWIFLCPLPCQGVLWIYKGFTNLTQSCAYPSSVLHMICEVLYLVKGFPNMQNHILAITRNLLISWRSQSHMQVGMTLSLVDPFTQQEQTYLCKCQQLLKCFMCHILTRKIDQNSIVLPVIQPTQT
jgi:hypothetical protein